MSLSDLRRLVQRATPRVEDHRAPDRRDFIRREHGHLTLREVIDAADALEFSASTFAETMGLIPGIADEEAPTAVHGLYRAASGCRFMCVALTAEANAHEAPDTAGGEQLKQAEGIAEDQQTAVDARQLGADCFKRKDFEAADKAYTEAISATASVSGELHTLYSNRSAARLQKTPADAVGALADARRCVELKGDWPKGHFREACCLRQLGRFGGTTVAFQRGRDLEPDNKDWAKEVEKTDQLRCGGKLSLVRQLLFSMLPELLGAWVRGNDPEGVLQVQVNGKLAEMGQAKWRLVREGKVPEKAQLRFAFLGRKDYLANLAGNLQSPPKGSATAHVGGSALKMAEVGKFLAPEDGSGDALLHVDVLGADGMEAVVLRVPCGAEVRRFLGSRKEPEPPKGAVENVLQLQRSSGFPKALPRLLGFQAFPGDLNFPVIDLARDLPTAAQ